MIVQSETVLDVATRVLLDSPTASMTEIARAAGVSRTTLHQRYPSRQALLVALAHEAMDLVESAYSAVDLDAGPALEALDRLVTHLVPLGPRLEFLVRERSLNDVPEVTARYAALDAPLVALVERGQREGSLRRDLAPWWVVAVLTGATYSTWEAIADGQLAPRDAGPLLLSTVLDGIGAP